MQTLRAFFAIDLPMSVKKTIHDHILMPLQEQNAHSLIRWVRPDHLHITLHFLPAIKMEDLKLLIHNVQNQLLNIQPVLIEFGNLERFPSPLQPKIISFQIKENPALNALVTAIGIGIMNTYYPIEKRLFRAHLTLGRFKSKLKMVILEDMVLPQISPIRVSQVTLFQSEPAPEGSCYTALSKLNLSD